MDGQSNKEAGRLTREASLLNQEASLTMEEASLKVWTPQQPERSEQTDGRSGRGPWALRPNALATEANPMGARSKWIGV